MKRKHVDIEYEDITNINNIDNNNNKIAKKESNDDNNQKDATVINYLDNCYKTPSSFLRPSVDSDNLLTHGITFQAYDFHQYSSKYSEDLCDCPNSPSVPIVQIFGITMDKHSVLVNLHNFFPYFYVQVPKDFTVEHCDIFKETCTNYLTKKFPQKTKVDDEFVKIFGMSMPQYFRNIHLRAETEGIKVDQIKKRTMEDDAKKWEKYNAFKKKYNNDASPENEEPKELYILETELITNKKSIMHSKSCTNVFIKMTLTSPRYISNLRDWLEGKIKFGDFVMCIDGYEDFYWHTFESDIQYVVRAMIDNNMDGCPWLCVKPTDMIDLQIENNNSITTQQICFSARIDCVKVLGCDGEWAKIAPLKRLSFDIECAASEGFPTAEKDPVIQISCIVQDVGASDKKKCLFSYGGCSNIVGSTVFCFKNESKMLSSWFKFFKDINADVVTGHNINNFDIPYILKRAETLNINIAGELCKLYNRPLTLEIVTFEKGSGASKEARRQQKKSKKDVVTLNILSRTKPTFGEKNGKNEINKKAGINDNNNNKTNGKNETNKKTGIKNNKNEKNEKKKRDWNNYQVNAPGIVFMDMLVMVKLYLKIKLRSYTLNYVAAEFLGDQKMDLPHTQITPLWKGNDEDRKKIGVYCIKDSDLPMRIMDKLVVIPQIIEMARITGLPIDMLIKHGQSKKVINGILRLAKKMNYLLPHVTNRNVDSKYQGATVLDPERGFYSDPVTVFDFGSLYPSIMIAHNLCPTTLLNKNQEKSYDPSQYHVTPNENAFLNIKTKEGLIPILLKQYLLARKKAKNDMENAKDEFTKSIMNGRQLAIKISANSVYGFLGFGAGSLPCLEVSESTTAYGRKMIEFTKKTLESTYCTNHVIYKAIYEVKTEKGTEYEFFMTPDNEITIKEENGNECKKSMSELLSKDVSWINDKYDEEYATCNENIWIYVKTTYKDEWRQLHSVRRRKNKHDAKVLYGDTDSVMTKLGPLPKDEVIYISKEANKYMTSLFDPPNVLEWEKMYKPYLLLSKKRYAALLWTKPDKYDKLDTKGIETVRRDNCMLTQEVVSTVLDKILIDENVQDAINYTKNVIYNLYTNISAIRFAINKWEKLL